MKERKQKSGFTLVEIMIVVAIIGILAALAMPAFLRSRNLANSNTCINNLKQLDSAKLQCALELKLKGVDPSPTLEELTVYLRSPDKTACPSNDGTYFIGATVNVTPYCPNFEAESLEFSLHKWP